MLTAGGLWRQIFEKVYRQRLRKADFLHLDPNLKGTDTFHSAGSPTITPEASREDLPTRANELAGEKTGSCSGTGFALGAVHVVCRVVWFAAWACRAVYTTHGAVGLRARCAAYILHPPTFMRRAK